MRRTNNNLQKTFWLLPLFLMLWAPSCLAERADHDKPITLEADQVLVDDAQQTSTFTGNVRLSQGSLLIRGDKIVVSQDKKGFKRATAYGKTAEFRQKREGSEDLVEGFGERIEYDTQEETLNLYKDARLKRDRDEVRGEHITYSAKTEIFQVRGGDAATGEATPPQRVRAVLQPKTRDNAASAPASDAVTDAFNEKPAPAK